MTAQSTMKPGISTPAMVVLPPTVQSTPKNTTAVSTAFRMPEPKSTTGSVAIRASSAMRNSGASRSGATIMRR